MARMKRSAASDGDLVAPLHQWLRTIHDVEPACLQARLNDLRQEIGAP